MLLAAKNSLKICLLLSVLITCSVSVSLATGASFFKSKLNEVVSYDWLGSSKLRIQAANNISPKPPSLKMLKNQAGDYVLMADFNTLIIKSKVSPFDIKQPSIFKQVILTNSDLNKCLRVVFTAHDQKAFKTLNFQVVKKNLDLSWVDISALEMSKVKGPKAKMTRNTNISSELSRVMPDKPKSNANLGSQNNSVALATVKQPNRPIEKTIQDDKVLVSSAIPSDPSQNICLAFVSLNSINVISESKIDYSLRKTADSHYDIVFNQPVKLVYKNFNQEIFKNITNSANKHNLIGLDLTCDNIGCEEKLDPSGQSLEMFFSPKPKENIAVSTGLDVYNDFVFAQPKTVVLDPGHGGSDPGAIRLNAQEKNITLDIINQLRQLLKQHNINIISTRMNDDFVSLAYRVKLANFVEPDLFLSVHINSLDKDSDITGIETYYCKDDSIDLAKAVHSNLITSLPTYDRQIRKAHFYVIKNTAIPSILAEVGFITSQDERSKLQSVNYRKQIAKSLATGIIKYLITTSKTTPTKPFDNRISVENNTGKERNLALTKDRLE